MKLYVFLLQRFISYHVILCYHLMRLFIEVAPVREAKHKVASVASNFNYEGDAQQKYATRVVGNRVSL